MTARRVTRGPGTTTPAADRGGLGGLGGRDPGKDPGKDPGDDPGDDPGEDPGDDPGDDSVEDPGDDPGEDPGDDPGDDWAASGEADPGDRPDWSRASLPDTASWSLMSTARRRRRCQAR
jgi:hypothetical protein